MSAAKCETPKVRLELKKTKCAPKGGMEFSEVAKAKVKRKRTTTSPKQRAAQQRMAKAAAVCSGKGQGSKTFRICVAQHLKRG